MTADYDAMTPAELAAEAARACGWTLRHLYEDVYVWENGSGNDFSCHAVEQWNPDQDANHAEEFLNHFLAAEQKQGRWWNCTAETVVEQRSGVQMYVRKVTLSRDMGQPGQVYMAKAETMARALTIVVLQAHEGVGG